MPYKGEKTITTIKDVSKLANVSVASVSKVLNGNYKGVSESTKERILQAAKKLKYRPNRIARGLVKNETAIIGLVVPDISNPYYSDIIKGAEEAASLNGYNVILCNTDEDAKKEKRHINMLLEYNCSGVIICGMQSPDNMIVLDEYEIPVITLDGEGDSGISFNSNSQRGAFLAIQYLVQMGHQKIAFIGGENGEDKLCPRYSGFISALKRLNLEQDNALYRSGCYDIETGYGFASDLLKEKRDFTAIFCGNDLIAFGAMKAVRESGLSVPGDISLIGYDDIVLSSFFEPKLTTIRQDASRIGKDMVATLLDSFENENPYRTVYYAEPTLIVRDSVRDINEKL